MNKFRIPKPVVDSEAAHSEYSPSGSSRFISCPASIKLSRTAPKEETFNFYAAEGTAAHSLGEFCLAEQVPPSSQIGKVFEKFTVDEAMARDVAKYVDYVNSQVPWDAQLLVESRLSLEHIAEGMFGTADAIVVSPTYLEVIDLKYGRGIVVEPEENSQLMLYTIGTLVHLANHGYKYPDSHEVKITICQPRAPHPEGPTRSWMTTIGFLKDFQKKVIAAVHESKGPNPRFGPTEAGCKYCAAGPFCKARATHNLNLAKIEFADFAKTKNDFEGCLNDASAFTKEEIVQILKHSKEIDNWLKSVVEFATAELKAGRSIPQYKLVYGRSIRAWENIEEVEEILLGNGVDPERIYAKKFRSPAQLEKELENEEWDLVEEKVFKPTGKVVIAPEHDPRKPIDQHQSAKDDWAKEEF